MGKTQQNLAASEEFIRSVLMRNFNQKIDATELRAAAEKLCEAVPGKKEKVPA
jgi:hypothetical protein